MTRKFDIDNHEDVNSVIYAAEEHRRNGGVSPSGCLRNLPIDAECDDAYRLADDAFAGKFESPNERWTMFKCEITCGIGFDVDGKPIPSADVESNITGMMQSASRHFGGCTLIRTQGGWLKGAEYIHEPGFILIVLAEHEATVKRLRAFAETVRHHFNQGSVVFSVTPATYEFV